MTNRELIKLFKEEVIGKDEIMRSGTKSIYKYLTLIMIRTRNIQRERQREKLRELLGKGRDA